MERIEHRACFGGWQDVYRHHSTTLGCDMQFAVYLPPQAETQTLPVLYWLSGLTCTEQNFITKAGAQRYAAEHGVIIVAPDTSPRGDDVADAEGYDLGKGAGFYLNATRAPWAKHFRIDCRGQRAPAVAGRPGRGGRVPADPAAAAAPAGGLRRCRPSADPAPAARLRPQLLLHWQLHRRAHRPPRPRPARLSPREKGDGGDACR